MAENLPEPDADALATSSALVEKIGQEIDASQGWLRFDRYMQMVLYQPGLGYYSAGASKIGAGGDFVTAPELGDWLAGALAAFLVDELASMERPRLLEIGAGTGRLAADLLAALAERGVDAVDYSILEASADLRARQQQTLARAGFDALWLDELPSEPGDLIVLANELVDALPVVRFEVRQGEILPLGVSRESDGLAVVPGPPDQELSKAVREIEESIGYRFPDGYRSELNLLLQPWLQSVLATVGNGGLMLIDYGLTQRDYYRADRKDGTLICHYRQRAHVDPLRWPGLCDLTAWVDFSRVAACAAGLDVSVAGFTTQAQFLIESIAKDPGLAGRVPTPQQASMLKTLLLPGEMGEHFKLMWLTRSDEPRSLPGRDLRNRL